MVTNLKWFLLDNKGGKWTPVNGTYESLRLAKEALERCNRELPGLGPFKLYESKTVTVEIE